MSIFAWKDWGKTTQNLSYIDEVDILMKGLEYEEN
jgi:hypothetical protein